MKNARTILGVCILVASLAGCGESSAPLAPADPRFNSGITIGSGGSAANSGTASTTTTDTGETGRGGPFTVGSGS